MNNRNINTEHYLLECKECELQSEPLNEYMTQCNFPVSLEILLKTIGRRERQGQIKQYITQNINPYIVKHYSKAGNLKCKCGNEKAVNIQTRRNKQHNKNTRNV